MRKVLIATALAFALTALLLDRAFAEECSLRGQWQLYRADKPTYVAIVLIDAARRVTYDSPMDNGRPAKFRGYIAKLDEANVEIALTDQVGVAHMNCAIESSDLLHCTILRSDGVMSPRLLLTRRTAGPKSLMPVIQ